MTDYLYINNLVKSTWANGPGQRVCIWVQGCTLGCEGCFNPNTHDKSTGRKISVDKLILELDAINRENPQLDGITISGGEPLQQWRALEQVLVWVWSHTKWSIILFTGYNLDELLKMPLYDDLLIVDTIIAGRYQPENRVANHLIGSSNKEVICVSSLYNEHDFETVPQAEVIFNGDGTITVTGINPPVLQGV